MVGRLPVQTEGPHAACLCSPTSRTACRKVSSLGLAANPRLKETWPQLRQRDVGRPASSSKKEVSSHSCRCSAGSAMLSAPILGGFTTLARLAFPDREQLRGVWQSGEGLSSRAVGVLPPAPSGGSKPGASVRPHPTSCVMDAQGRWQESCRKPHTTRG